MNEVTTITGKNIFHGFFSNLDNEDKASLAVLAVITAPYILEKCTELVSCVMENEYSISIGSFSLSPSN